MTDESRATRYTVLASPAKSLLEIKRSEFIGLLKRVDSEQEARDFIESTRKTYHDARHVCSAFLIGPDRSIQRSSDDGEPAGTAGIPILQTLLSYQSGSGEGELSQDLSDVVAVVVRYFGGIKLGAGGLVRAYTEAVAQTLEQARTLPRQRLRTGHFQVAHDRVGRLENDLRQASGLRLLETSYRASGALIAIGVFDDDSSRAAAQSLLASLTAGQSAITWGDSSWVDLS